MEGLFLILAILATAAVVLIVAARMGLRLSPKMQRRASRPPGNSTSCNRELLAISSRRHSSECATSHAGRPAQSDLLFGGIVLARCSADVLHKPFRRRYRWPRRRTANSSVSEANGVTLVTPLGNERSWLWLLADDYRHARTLDIERVKSCGRRRRTLTDDHFITYQYGPLTVDEDVRRR